jgi:hypothetical protein
MKHYTATVTDVRSIGASCPGGGSTIVGKSTVMSCSAGRAYRTALKLAEKHANRQEADHKHGNYFVSVLLLVKLTAPNGETVLDASI